jgi:RNA polymerase sigma-70 factor (ECF subfamily)
VALPDDSDDAELMRRFQRGDARAFELLLARHRRGIYNYCLRTLSDRTAAEDATQEVFLRLVKAAATWERQAKVSTWLYTLARNHCIDLLRRAKHRKTDSLDRPFNGEEGVPVVEMTVDREGISPERGADAAQVRPLLQSALAALPAEQRDVFVMREHAGMGFKEIGDVLGVSENTAKSRMRYALEHLRHALARAGILSGGGS